VLEDEMLKVAETQQDFQLATMLYSKSLGLLKMAVKRG
jgi:flagellar basal-body rod protein FlgB